MFLVVILEIYKAHVMRHSTCTYWKSLALPSCFLLESTTIGKRPRKWKKRICDNFSANPMKLSNKRHESKYIMTLTRRKYYMLLVLNLVHSLQIHKTSVWLSPMDLSDLKWDYMSNGSYKVIHCFLYLALCLQ